MKHIKSLSFKSTLLDPVINNLSNNENLWHKDIPVMVQAYFDDMSKIFQSLKTKLRQGGNVWLVVSTSAYGGIHIPVDLIIADIATQASFSLQGIYCLRNLRAAGQQWKKFQVKTPPLRESLIILKKQ